MIIGGLFEVGFASCLGKANETKRNLLIGCWVLLCLSISMLLLYKTTQNYLLVQLMRFGLVLELWELF
jgi:quaternary ammonium compound-resistance protein SugE